LATEPWQCVVTGIRPISGAAGVDDALRDSATTTNFTERIMSGKPRVLVTALVTVLAMGAGAQAAAAWELSAPWPAAVAGTPVPGYDVAAGGAKDYEVVESGARSDWPLAQTHDEVVCPVGKPISGGAQIFSSALGENLASSYPTTQGWAVDVNNTTTTPGVFDIYAVCANPKDYKVIGYDNVSNARAGGDGGGDHGCTKGTKLLGGGVQSNSTDTNVSIRESEPLPQNFANWAPGMWLSLVDNLGSQDVDVDSFLICGEVKHTYQVVKGTTSIDRAGTREQLNVYCPTGTRPLGGGIDVDPHAGLGVALNSTFPWPTGWSAIENNTTTGDATITDSVVCE
jgi:hypothetical protein